MKPLDALGRLLFPPKCVFCRKLLPRAARDVCSDCEKTLPYFDGLRHGKYFSVCAAPLRYEGTVRKALHRYKFDGQESYAPVFARFVADAVRCNGLEADCLTWVPVSRVRRRARGYDQAELLCCETAKLLGLPALRLLEKTVDNSAQSELSREARQANVLGVYQATDRQFLAGKRILLIDDVVTSGATLSECSRVLLTAGAAEVLCAAFACATGREDEEQTCYD